MSRLNAERRQTSSDERKALLLEVWIESESLGHASLSHRDEGHGVDETQPTLTPLEQQVEAGLMQRLVHPDHFNERREVRAKTSERFETEPPAGERICFD
jgi:hypothetical protein